MRYLKGRGEFNFDRIDESRLYLSPKFRNRLHELDNEISSRILNSELTDVKPDMTLIDISGEDGFVSFTQINKANKLVQDVHDNLDLTKGTWRSEAGDKILNRSMLDTLYNNDINKSSISTGIFTKGRNKTKLGRLVNKLFPGEYKDSEIEEFVNIFKSKYTVNDERFELVSGEDISKWYKCEGVKGSTLGKSCMVGLDESVFNIYTENPKVCRLLILLDSRGKLIGRSLIWKVNILDGSLDFEYFMDRIYTNLDSDVYKFIKFAQDKGWAHKTEQNHSSHRYVTYNGKEYKINMSVDIGTAYYDSYDYDSYPYMDTFSEYVVSDGTLYNNSTSENEGIILNDTDGGYNENGYWSNYFATQVPESEAVFSGPLNDWLILNYSVYIENNAIPEINGYYPTDHDDIFFYDGDYYHVSQGVESGDDGKWILSDDATSVLHDVNDDGSISDEDDYWLENDSDLYISFGELYDLEWFEEMNNNHKWDDYFNGILEVYLTKDYNDDWIFIPTAITTFKTKNEWLMEEDILVLGEKKVVIDGSVDTRIESEYDYFKRVWIESDRNPYEIIKDIDKEIKKLDNILNPDNRQLDFDDKDEYLHRVRDKLNSLYSIQRDFKKRLSDRYESDPDPLIDDRVNSMFNGEPNEATIRHKMVNIRKEFTESWTGYDGGSDDRYMNKFKQAYDLVNDGKYMKEDYIKSTIFVYTYISPALETGDIKMNRKDMSKLYKEVNGYDITNFEKEIGLGYKLIKRHNERNVGKYNIENFLRKFDDGVYEALEEYLKKRGK